MKSTLPVLETLGSEDLGDRRKTRRVEVGSIAIGGEERIALQSMCATKTTDIKATLSQIRLLESAGADIIRIAIDSRKDIEALEQIRKETSANLVVDLQENYRLAEKAGPFVQKFRYNPGHLHHHQRNVPVEEKVKYLVDTAGEFDCAIRIGVNFGSLDPNQKADASDPMEAALASATEHVALMDKFGFERFVVSLKSSDPRAVVAINREFAARAPLIPLHLGVTEAGMLPDGAIKTRIAFEQLLAVGIGETVRVSLTLPDNEKDKEILTAREIITDVQAGRFRSVPEFLDAGLNVISCPSCSRVENRAFVHLAQQVKEALEPYKDRELTVAVMGCRVNGPGETDEADLGLWCAPTFVNLKRGEALVGKFSYDEVIGKLLSEVDSILDSKEALASASQ